MNQTTHIYQYNTHGDNIVAVGATDRIQADLLGYALWAGGAVCIGAVVYGFALGAVAFGAMIAPYVVSGALAAGTGIGAVKVWQHKLLKQAAAQPAPLILSPEALEVAARLRLAGHTLTDADLAAVQRLTDKLCAPLQPSSPSASLQSRTLSSL